MATEPQNLPNRLNAPKIEICSTLSLLALSAACLEPCRMGRSVEGPALRSRVISRHLYICREPSTNQLLFMQNKPNFQNAQMNVNPYITTDYKNKSNWTLGENKPNSNPIKPNFRKAKMNVNSLITKDYIKYDDFAVQKNKPNSNPISERPKGTQTYLPQRIMKMNHPQAPKKQTQNKPNQSQGIGNELKSPISPILTKCPIYQRSYPAMRLNI